SQPLNRGEVPLLNIPVDLTQSNKQIKTKRSKSDRISNSPVITKDSIEKMGRGLLYSTDTQAHFRRVVKEGEENLSYSEWKIDES
ncbi:1918_t:CDS:1, partial [Diversispora eburnea]